MDRYEQCANMIWDAIISSVREKVKGGMKQQAVAELLKVNKATISTWVRGERKAQNARMADILRYTDALGINISPYLPWAKIPSVDCSELEKELAIAKAALADANLRAAKAESRAEAFREALQLASGQNVQEKSIPLPGVKLTGTDVE